MRKTSIQAAVLAAAALAAGAASAVTDTYTAPGTPVAIPDNGNIAVVASAPGPAAGTNVTDVDITVGIAHTWAADIDITLASSNPAVAATTIINDCGGNGDYAGTVTFDDEAGAPQGCAGGTIVGNGSVVQSPLGNTVMATFDGAAAVGAMTWTLNVADDSSICTGTLNSFSVTVTSDLPLPVELSTFSVD